MTGLVRRARGGVTVAWAGLAKRPWVLLPALSIPAWWSFVSEGLPRSYDGALHLLRAARLGDHLVQGQFFPRWLPELMLGYGYPVFNYYAPGSYYAVAALHLLGLSYYSAMVITFAAAFMAAGIGMYLWASDIFGTKHPGAALVSATAYMYAPYLFMNVYISGALPAAWGQAILPWVFWSVRRLFYARQPGAYLLPVGVSLAALALTHNVTLLFTAPALIAYTVVVWWQTGRSARTLVWAVAGMSLAMGVSAFFWLPAFLERTYLSDTAHTIAVTRWLPGSFWTLSNLLDTRFRYGLGFERPIRLGLVQLVLATTGFAVVMARRASRQNLPSRAEWWLLAAIAVGTCALMMNWAQPLWQASELLSMTQFPWRLLTIVSLPLALFTGGIVFGFNRSWGRIQQGHIVALAGSVLLGAIILAHAPHLDWMDMFSPLTVQTSVPVEAQLERDQGAFAGGEGSSYMQEYKPRWADKTLTLVPTGELPPSARELTIHTGSAYSLDLTVGSDSEGPLRFSDFYFPGWSVMLDQSLRLQTYPSTNLGLLTVDVPVGRHTLQVRWSGTPLQQWSDRASLVALAILTVATWFVAGRARWLSIVPAVALIAGLSGLALQQPATPIVAARQPVQEGGIRLLGYRVGTNEPGNLYIYPYWYTYESPPPVLRARWLLMDETGQMRAEALQWPYYNTSSSGNWPPGTLVDDAYRLSLPPGLPAGRYELALQLASAQEAPLGKPVVVGDVVLAAPVPLAENETFQPSNFQTGRGDALSQEEAAVEAPARSWREVQARLGDAIILGGFSLISGGRPVAVEGEKPPVIPAGSRLEYLLSWKATGPVDRNYHAFLHLVDINGQPLAQEDHLPGPLFQPPALWSSERWENDWYLLRIPRDGPSGLYWPLAGMYDFATLERLPTYDSSGAGPGDHVRLPPVKIIGQPAKRPEHEAYGRFGEEFELVGYDLDIPAEGVRPSSQVTLTLYYKSKTPTSRDYTRFLHLYSSELGMAAQSDSPPQRGGNPTWSWVPGEVVTDPVELSIGPDVQPGVYKLQAGFYDPSSQEDLQLAAGARLPVYGKDGAPLPDAQVELGEIRVRP
jgi:hypothetical protein